LLLSFWWDLPSGATIVCTLGAMLVLTALGSVVRPRGTG
jgi:ABC-type Mn2+/Zn2+ transport system permease subunit